MQKIVGNEKILTENLRLYKMTSLIKYTHTNGLGDDDKWKYLTNCKRNKRVSTKFWNLGRRIFTCSKWGNCTAVDYFCQNENMMRRGSLTDGLDFTSFRFLQLSSLFTPIIYVQNSNFCNILLFPLLQFTPSIIHVLPFPHGTVRKLLCILK